MAPGKTPDVAVDSTHKPMPEYPLDPTELVYPGDGDVLVHDPPDPFDVAKDPLKVACMEACAVCAEACERVADGAVDVSTMKRALTLARSCADVCLLTRDFIDRARTDEMMSFMKAVGTLCAQTCRACADACAAHPDVPVCGPCVAAADVCANACEALVSAA